MILNILKYFEIYLNRFNLPNFYIYMIKICQYIKIIFNSLLGTFNIYNNSTHFIQIIF